MPNPKKNIKAKQVSIGEILPKEVMFLTISAGDATDKESGEKYELKTSATTGAMIVVSEKSGRQLLVDWSKLIQYAADKGIDNE